MSEWDAYAVLGLERELTLDAEILKSAYLDAGKKAHPDAGGSSAAFEEVQRASATLEKPVTRLRHWLELSGKPGEMRGSVSNALMTMFMELGELMQKVDELLHEREKASSALAKAMLEGRVQECREALESAQGKIEQTMEASVAKFPQIEANACDGWEVARDLAFLEKWRGEVRSRYAQLW